MKLPNKLSEDVMTALRVAHWGLDYAHANPGGEMYQEALDKCKDGECPVCAVIVCPFQDPMHFHHDGCPSCYTVGKELGREVREAWVRACKELNYSSKPEHLVPWEELDEASREVDRRIGWAVLRYVIDWNEREQEGYGPSPIVAAVPTLATMEKIRKWEEERQKEIGK